MRQDLYKTAIARGLVPGKSIREKFGGGPGIGTSPVTIWPDVSRLTYPSSAEVMKLSSTSANDAAAGSGARTVLLEGLIAGYIEATETVTLNGQTGVETATEWLRMPRMKVVTAGGTLNENAGTIWLGTGTITAGVPAVKHAMIAPLNGQTLQAFDTVPAGYELLIDMLYADVGVGKTFTCDLYTREVGGAWQTKGNVVATEGGRERPVNIVVPEKADVEMRGSVDASTIDVAAGFFGVLQKV